MKYPTKRLDDVDELVSDLSEAYIRFHYGQIPLEEVNAFLNEIAAEVFHSQCRRRDEIHKCRDRLKCNDLSEKERQRLKTRLIRVKNAHDSVTNAYEQLQNLRDQRQAGEVGYKDGFANGHNIGYIHGKKEGEEESAHHYDLLMSEREERLRKGYEAKIAKNASALAAEKGKYFILIPPQGLPNGGKIVDPPLKKSVFEAFVYSQMYAVEKAYQHFKGKTIADYMTDGERCEWASWLKEASSFLRICRSPESWAKGYRTWKHAQKNKAADKKGLSAGRVGKTAGVRQNKKSFAHDANEVAAKTPRESSD